MRMEIAAATAGDPGIPYLFCCPEIRSALTYNSLLESIVVHRPLLTSPAIKAHIRR